LTVESVTVSDANKDHSINLVFAPLSGKKEDCGVVILGQIISCEIAVELSVGVEVR